MDWSKSQLQVVFKQLRHFLPDDEEVEYAVVARNHPNLIYVRPALLATDRRLIYLEPKWIGLSSTPRAYAYADFAEVHLSKGIFTNKISLTPYPGRGLAALVVDYLEKRRSAAFVEYVASRIGTGEIIDHGPGSPADISIPPATDPLVEKLAQLKRLYDEGLLSAAEYGRMKEKVLEQL